MPTPVDEKLVRIDRSPLHGEAERSRRQGSVQDAWTLDRDLRLVFSIYGVEVRRQVILELHSNDDPEEPRHLRHRPTVRTRSCLALTSPFAGACRHHS